MLAVVQRVSRASVVIDGKLKGSIRQGLMVLLGVEKGDKPEEAEYLARKITGLRIFSDDAQRMNRSVMDVSGSVLVVSQFTLLGDCRKGRRPSFVHAAAPAEGEKLYEYFVSCVAGYGVTVETGEFGAMMQVELVNDGPVTLIIDTRKCVGERVPVC